MKEFKSAKNYSLRVEDAEFVQQKITSSESAEDFARKFYFDDIEIVDTQQMFYSKRTGQVSPTPDLERLRSADFSAERRVTKESAVKPGVGKGSEGQKGGSKKWAVRDGSTGSAVADRNKSIDDFNVKITEFVVTARINYAGKLKTAESAGEGANAPLELEKK